MMTKLLSETSEIENLLLAEKLEDTPTQYQLNLLAKHFRSLGKGRIGIQKSLIDFCKTKFEYFNPIIRRSSIMLAVKVGMNHPIRELSDVYITQNELDEIKTVPYFKIQKVLFSFLVFIKSMNPIGENGVFMNGTDQSNIRQILKISDTRWSLSDFENITPYLHSCCLMDGYIVNKTSYIYIPLYIGEFQPKEWELMIPGDVSEIEKAGVIYKDYRGGELYWCSNCGEEGVKTSNRQTKCAACSDIFRKFQYRKQYKKRKSSA